MSFEGQNEASTSSIDVVIPEKFTNECLGTYLSTRGRPLHKPPSCIIKSNFLSKSANITPISEFYMSFSSPRDEKSN